MRRKKADTNLNIYFLHDKTLFAKALITLTIKTASLLADFHFIHDFLPHTRQRSMCPVVSMDLPKPLLAFIYLTVL